MKLSIISRLLPVCISFVNFLSLHFELLVPFFLLIQSSSYIRDLIRSINSQSALCTEGVFLPDSFHPHVGMGHMQMCVHAGL